MDKRWLLTGLVLYLFCAAILFPFLIGVPWDSVFASDAVGYSTGAKNLLLQGFYTFDGVHPFLDREPGMSFFLVPIYALFGIENVFGLVLVQSVLYFLAAWWFCVSLAKIADGKAAGMCFLLLLTSGSVFHTIFSAYRECLVLTLFLCFGAAYLSTRTKSSWIMTILMGILLGYIILTYYSFVFLPLFLIPAWWRDRRSLKELTVVFLVCYAVLLPWALRNYSYDGRFRIIDNRRTAVMWYVRGEQAQQIRGLEPIRCLWSEYVSRDWTGRSPACSYNGLMNTHWSEGFDLQADYGEEARAGKAKILANVPFYLWFSLFEITELHLPYLGGGWSHAYNLYAALTAAILYVGFFVGIRRLKDPAFSLFLALIVYNTAVFILTDATPRYLLPVFFCYAAVAGIGYADILSRTQKRA